MRSSTPSRREHGVVVRPGQMVLDSTPTLKPRSRRALNSGRTSGSVRVCGSQNSWYAASARSVRLEPQAFEDRRQRGRRCESARARAQAARSAARIARGDRPRRRSAMVLTRGVDAPLLVEVDRVPGRERAAPVEDDRADLDASRSRADRRCEVVRPPSSTGTCDAVAGAPVLDLDHAVGQPAPTTTIVGTPISSESLNFTPGRDALPVVEQHPDARAPPARRRSALRPRRPRRPCRWPRRARRPARPRAASTARARRGVCSAMAATARETPMP